MNLPIIFTLIICVLVPISSFSQEQHEWQHLDPEEDNVLGVSTYKAYDFLKNKDSKEVVVAVIDNGAELSHTELKNKLWVNEDEIAENGIDDDENGFIDDIHGWNFLGNANGENMKRETTELTRVYARLKEKYSDGGLTILGQEDFNYYTKVKDDFEKAVKNKKDDIKFYKILLGNYTWSTVRLTEYFGHADYSKDSVQNINSNSTIINSAKDIVLGMMDIGYDDKTIESIIKNMEEDLKTRLNPDFEIRKQLIGDNPSDINDSIYGNNQVEAMGPYHGTGVAGTIGALWDENGISGVAKNVRLMILRVLPNGDERDKDVALAIRYAVRNGADIINCSFGKPYSPNEEFVQDAIKEAECAGVLIVHAAGNNGENNDSIPVFPTGFYQDGKRAKNWICVGATGKKDSANLVTFFSNYGKSTVDIFAPGIDVKSCALGSKYDLASGTSVAAPIVSGIAAVLKSYYPHLSAEELKDIILKSGYKPNTAIVKMPGKSNQEQGISELSKTGLIANLYKAVLLAEEYERN